MAALLIRILFFTGGIRGSDAYAYALQAFKMASGQYQINSIDSFYGFRFAVILPTAFSYALFGVSDYSSVLFLYLSSLLNICVVYLLAEKIFDRNTAIISCILLAIYPLDIATTNTLSPDSFIPFLSTMAIMSYFMAEQKSDLPRLHNAYLLISGLFIAFAYLARITSIFLFAAILCHHIFRKQKKSSLLWVMLGLAIPLCLEAFYYYIYSGDPFFHHHTISIHNHLVKGSNPDAIVSLFFYPRVMFGFDLTGLAFYGLMWWLVVAGLILAFNKKDKKILLPAFFLIIPFLGFEFGTQSLKEMIPIMKNYNYLSLITCSAVLIGAYSIKEGFTLLFANSHKRLLLLILTLSIIASMNLYGIYRLTLNEKNDAAPYVVVADNLKSKPQRTIYVHHERWPLFLKYFLRYDNSYNFRLINDMNVDQISKISDAYIILHKRYLEADTAGRLFSQLPDYAHYLTLPPQNWNNILEFGGSPSYNTVSLYYAK